MYSIEQEQFEKYVTESIDRLPEPYKSSIQNVAFFVEEEPDAEQRERLGLRPCQSLFGLYEGIPLPKRNGNTGNMLPDRIMIFKKTHEQFANSEAEVKKQVGNTVWHEVAHYFGLDHKRIHELENKL
jgi:predicted Zn-dependent protease with MMP-like domain